MQKFKEKKCSRCGQTKELTEFSSKLGSKMAPAPSRVGACRYQQGWTTSRHILYTQNSKAEERDCPQLRANLEINASFPDVGETTCVVDGWVDSHISYMQVTTTSNSQDKVLSMFSVWRYSHCPRAFFWAFQALAASPMLAPECSFRKSRTKRL